ncbi:MAG: hypothetical protein WC052_04455 [Patescibacteria group bacterium]
MWRIPSFETVNSDAGSIYLHAKYLPENEWTEELALELIERVTESYLDLLIDSIPTSCKTYKV